MLSRVANSIYWMSRYVERAENVARFIEVNLHLMLDDATEGAKQWAPLVNTTGDHADFKARYGFATQENVIRFLAIDPENPNSIYSCVRAARENARSVREIISSEMWLQLNTFYLMIKSAAEDRRALDDPHEFFASVRHASHLFAGITDGTMSRTEAWHFGRLGRMIERADKTSRILDVKYYILLRSVDDVGTPFDENQWAALLRSASAFEMYRQKHGKIVPACVVEFLMFDHEFPRSVRFSIHQARESLHAISGTSPHTFRYPPEKHIGQLNAELSFASVDDVLEKGLHEYVDDLQTRLNEVGLGIHETFFAMKKPA